MLILEGAQAGLSWITILRKREDYRRAFDGFDAAKIARYSDARSRSCMPTPGIVRNRLKIAGAVQNARAFLAVQKEFGSFDELPLALRRRRAEARTGRVDGRRAGRRRQSRMR